MPIVPVAPIISSVTSTTALITLGVDGNPVGTFYSIRMIDGSDTFYLNNLGSLTSTKTFFVVSGGAVTAMGLTPNTDYAVALSAADDALGTSETSYGLDATFTTSPAAPIAGPFTAVFSTTVTATWDANSNPSGTQYYVELSADPSFVVGVDSSGWITTVGFKFVNLLPTTTYYGRVKSRSSILVESSFVGLGNVLTATGPEPLHVLNVIALFNERGYLLRWSPALEANVVSYKVFRSPSPTDVSSYAQVGVTPAAVTSFIDQVPYSFGIVYYYRVVAVDDGGNEGSLELSSPVHDLTYHDFEERPFPITVTTTDFVSDEVPVGVVDGSNQLFTSLFAYRKNTAQVYLNGVRLSRTTDFVEGPLSQQVTFNVAPSVGDLVRFTYIKY